MARLKRLRYARRLSGAYFCPASVSKRLITSSVSIVRRLTPGVSGSTVARICFVADRSGSIAAARNRPLLMTQSQNSSNPSSVPPLILSVLCTDISLPFKLKTKKTEMSISYDLRKDGRTE